MDQRSAFLLQIIEKVGLPLTAAVAAVSTSKGNADIKKDAENVAELLGRSVKSSVSLAEALELRDTDGNADSVRLVLAALSGELLAGQYRASRRMPAEKDLDRITASLSAVLAFADNFSAVAKNTARLKALEIDDLACDENQIQAVFFRALVPAINAIAVYPFGRPETKLIQEVAGKLTRQAELLREKLFGSDLPEPEARQVELSLFHSLVSLYTECHKVETDRIQSMNEAEREKMMTKDGGVSMESLWQAFETRYAMLEAVSQSMLPGAAAQQSGASDVQTPSPPAPPPPPTAKAEDQTSTPAIFKKNPPTPPAGQPPATDPAPPPAQAQTTEATQASPSADAAQGENPMAFFKPGVKKSGEQEGS